MNDRQLQERQRTSIGAQYPVSSHDAGLGKSSSPTFQERWNDQHSSVKMAEGALALMLLYMTVEAVRTRRAAPFLPSVRYLMANPWGTFTFKDFYMNTILLSLWTLAREKNRWKSSAWIFSYIMLGSFGTIAFALKELLQLPKDAPPQRF